jgi:hypothetical protein
MKKLLCVAVLLMACGGDDGGGGGGNDSQQLGSLTTEEATALCNDLAGDYPEKTVSCPDGDTTIGFEDGACDGDQTFDSSCTATVGEARDCYDALYNEPDADICSQTIPEECAPLLSCT